VTLTGVTFNPLVFVALDLSVVGNTGIVFVLKDFCLLAA
jgi:hypothetical protein